MLYIIRHGQTDWNTQYRIQGSEDIALNETGRQMAIEAGKKYRSVHIDLCYTSPLRRAYETARLMLRGRAIPIIADDRLREMNFGGYEGCEHVYEHPEWNIYNFFKHPETYVADRDAESIDHLMERTGDFLESVIRPALAEGKDILIVGHGAMNASIINRVLGIPRERYWEKGQKNCEMMELPVSW